MDVVKLSQSQLKNVLSVGRKDFMNRRQCSEMADKFFADNCFPGLSRNSVGEYLGNKVDFLNTPQLVSSVKYIRSLIGEENYSILLGQCGINYVAVNQLSLA